eukprot:TRINITY_DN73281_c0_g1_i1.p1 TRINITY_DN73281_c0_g1~~TRINITY_DN73281_c0_g1_i1.p1  ORF type:complete len:961 (+),score=193.03 TRINITY_DN73281_c0_g1_i1:189-2885(+)
MELEENLRVSFLVYGDGGGLGAEEVRPDAAPGAQPVNLGVATIVRTRGNQQPSQASGYPDAAGFAPSAPAAPTVPTGPRPQQVIATGPTYAATRAANRGMALLGKQPATSSSAPAWGGARQQPAAPKAAAASSTPAKAWPCPPASRPSKAAAPAKATPPKAPLTGWDDEEEADDAAPAARQEPEASAGTEGAQPQAGNRWNRQNRPSGGDSTATAPAGAAEAPGAAAATAPKAKAAAGPKSSAAKAKSRANGDGHHHPRGTSSQGSASAPQPMDAMSMAAAAAAAYSLPPGTHRWWQQLEGDCCPISLTSLEELTIDPFGLLGTSTDSPDVLPVEGIWGTIAEKMVRDGKGETVHWFDGMFLASFLVSSGQLIDPVNRRALSRGECKSLDQYLKSHRLPAVHVTDTFDLTRAVKGNRQQQAASESGDSNATRMAALEREAASMLRSLFDFRSAGVGVGAVATSQHSAPPAQPPPPQPPPEPPVMPAQQQVSSQEEAGSTSQDWPRQAPVAPRERELTNRRTIHNDSGLQVVDDDEFEEGFDDQEQEAPPEATAEEPTLADSLAPAPARRQKIARLPRNRGEGAQLTFSITGRVHAVDSMPESRAAAAASSSTGVRGMAAEDSEAGSLSDDDRQTGAGLLEVEGWLPDWASSALHERTLAEVELVEAMFPDECRLLTPDVRIHLQDCVDRGVVSRQATPMRLELTQHLDGAAGGIDVVLEFSLPSLYPLHEATLSLRDASEETGDGPSARVLAALASLQATMRTDVLQSLEGSEVIVKVVDWLNQHGPAELARCERGAEDKVSKAKGAAPKPAAAPEKTKEEKVAEARKERNAQKHTETWDLCAAFVQHGKCKNKNCRWRHEAMPPKEIKKVDEKSTDETKETESASSTKPKSGKKKGK